MSAYVEIVFDSEFNARTDRLESVSDPFLKLRFGFAVPYFAFNADSAKNYRSQEGRIHTGQEICYESRGHELAGKCRFQPKQSVLHCTARSSQSWILPPQSTSVGEAHRTASPCRQSYLDHRDHQSEGIRKARPLEGDCRNKRLRVETSRKYEDHGGDE